MQEIERHLGGRESSIYIETEWTQKVVQRYAPTYLSSSPSQVLIWLLVLSCQGDVSPIKCKARRFQKCHKFTHVFKSSDRDRWHTERRFWLIVIFSDYLEIIWVFLSWHLGCKVFGLMQSLQLMETSGEFRRDDFPGCQCGRALAARALGRGWRSEMGTQTCRVQSTSSTSSTRHTHTIQKGGVFFPAFFLTSFWLLVPSASGFWLVASGFWLHFSMEGIFFWGSFIFFGGFLLVFLKNVFVFSVWGSFPSYLLHFGAKISDLRAICCILELKYPIWPSALGFWFWLHLALGFWFLISVGFLALVSLGFRLWLLAALLLNVCVVL